MKREIIKPMAPHIDERSLGRILSGRVDALDWDSFSPADWGGLLRLAQAEGVSPLLYRRLSESGELARAPDALARFLRADYTGTRLHNERLVEELGTLAGLFSEAGIPVVALKGICFALTVYPDPGLRPMADLDLLVPAARLPEAVLIAGSLGYEEALPDASPGLTELLSHHVCLKKNLAPFATLELHHSLVAGRSFRYAVPVDWFWGQTEPLPRKGPGKSIPHLHMLTPTAQLLFACGHAMLQHGGRNATLRWTYDLDRLVRAYAGRIDWELLTSQARTFEWASAVEAGLSRAKDLLDTPVPPEVLAGLRKIRDRNAERVVRMQTRPVTHTQEEIQKLRSLDWYGRIRLFLALAIPAPAYMRWRYRLKNSWALPAWYFYRWWDILKDAVRTVLQFIRKDGARVVISGSSLGGPPDVSQ